MAEIDQGGGGRGTYLQQMLDVIDQGFCLFDGELRLRAWNRAYARLMGYADTLLREGTPYEAFLWDNARRGEYGPPPHNDQVRSVLESVRARKFRSKEWRRTDGTIILYDRHPTPDGGFVATMLDVTDRRQSEFLRSDLERRLSLHEKMEAVGTLAGGVAHDFDNILSAIAGYGELAATKLAADAPAQPYLAEVQAATRRAQALSKRLLGFARTGPAPRTRQPLAGIVRETLRLVRPRVHAAVRIVEHHDDDLFVTADVVELGQVVLNLTTNAAQAMPEGGVLTLRTDGLMAARALPLFTGELPAGDWARLIVTDTGHGMSEAVRGRAFDPFFTTKAKGAGTGLGLYTVFRIVERHGGHLDIASAPGAGTAFSVYLPQSSARDSDRPESDAMPCTAHPAPPAARLPTALVVDDDPVVVDLLASILEQLDVAARRCTDAAAALAALRAQPDAVDIVFTDLAMPSMDGLTLGRELLRIRPSLPVFLIAAAVGPDRVREAMRIGFRGVLQKPVTLDEVRSTLVDTAKIAGDATPDGKPA